MPWTIDQAATDPPNPRTIPCALESKDSPAPGLVIEPPPWKRGSERLFRVVYVIDASAPAVLEAARQAHRIMIDPESMPPVLEILDHSGKVVSIDLSEEASG